MSHHRSHLAAGALTILAIFACALLALPVLAETGAAPVEGEGVDMGLLIPALVALGAALVRAAIIVVRPNAAKLGKVGTVLLLVLSVAAGFLEHLAGGGGVLEALAVALSLLGGGVVGGAVSKLPVVQERAAKIKGGSIGLGR